MDKHPLRSIILKLQDRLSDDDRQRLHFFLGNDVPRRIRDNPTLNGTLNLMESLFDQDKINEQDFTLLINAFNEIQCFDAVKVLKEHKQRMQSNRSNQQTLTTIMPSLHEQVFQDQEEDKSLSPTFLHQINNYGNYSKIINSTNTNITPLTITVDHNKISSSQSKRNQQFHLSSTIYKYIFIFIFLLIILCGIVTGLFILNINQTNISDYKLKYLNILQELNEKNQQIEQLNKQLTTQNNEKINSLIIAGRQFGSTNGDYFDDSTHPDFTCLHYLNGIYARDENNNGLESYQFYYSSSVDHQNSIESETHGNQTSRFQKKFELDENEKVNRVEGQIVKKHVLSSNGTNITISIITGIQFSTTNGRMTPSYEKQLGEAFSEEFAGYILGYVTGRSAQYIHQLQFYWYRTTERD